METVDVVMVQCPHCDELQAVALEDLGWARRCVNCGDMLVFKSLDDRAAPKASR
jgi:hypothetical protein